MITTHKTAIKQFSGFYNTIWEPQEDVEIDYVNQERKAKGLKDEIEFYDFEFDYREYENNVGEQFTSLWFEHMTDFIHKVKFCQIDSPKEYNFRNDSIEIEIELTAQNKKDIKSFLDQNFDEFSDYIKKHHSSYSGFISFYSNDANEWILEDDLLEDYCKLESVLDFIFEINYESVFGNSVEMDFYGSMNDLYLPCINADELINRPDQEIDQIDDFWLFPHFYSTVWESIEKKTFENQLTLNL